MIGFTSLHVDSPRYYVALRHSSGRIRSLVLSETEFYNFIASADPSRIVSMWEVHKVDFEEVHS